MNQSSEQTSVDARYRILLVIWLAMLSSVGTLFLISMLVERPTDADRNRLLFWILMLLGGITYGLSFGVKRKFLAQSVEKQSPALVQQAYILAWAFCEATGILGLLIHFLSGLPVYFLLFIFAALGMLLHMPRRVHLLDASFKAQKSVME